MKIAYITAGAAGMYCGSCMHDNTLAAALTGQGHDAVLIPTYTPIRTDEPDVSQARIFFGGINVYLQQKLPVFRYTPWRLDHLWNGRRLLRWVGRFAVKTQAQDLADITISMLRGKHGHQRKEVAKLVYWLATDLRPDVVILTTVLLSGIIPELKERLGVPVLGMLQGDDIFLEALPDAARGEALDLIRGNCRQIDGFIASSGFYADFMSAYLDIARAGIHVVHPGLRLAGHRADQADSNGRPFTIGYFARICPEKGLHVLVDAFRILAHSPGAPPCFLRVSGWLGENNRHYFDGIQQQLKDWNLSDRFTYVDSPTHADKVKFLQSIDVLSVPTTYREPKGLYVLEALANGVPVVQPRHGSFPEIVEATGGGLLVNPGDPEDLAQALRRLRDDPALRRELGRSGQATVHRLFNSDVMARKTVEVLQRYV